MAKNISSFNQMTKSELEEYGRSLGIELDKRLKKAALIKQIQEFLEAPQTIDSIRTRPDRVHEAEEKVASDSDINALISSAPEYSGSNNGELSSYFMRNLNKLSGHKVKFGPKGKKYVLTINGKEYKI